MESYSNESGTNVSKVAVVTGGNKGIGFSVVKGLAKDFNGQVYLTARNVELGLAAIKKLNDLGLKANFHQLDIDDIESIRNFATYLKNKYGGLDVLVNNAGVAYHTTNKETLRKKLVDTIRVNYFGTLNVCDALFPLLRSDARVINVTSDFGCITRVYNQNVKQMLLDTTNYSIDYITSIMNTYVKEAQEPDYDNFAYEDYMVSKNGLNAVTTLQQEAFDQDTSRQGIIVSAVHPGDVLTDLNHLWGELSPDQGAETIIYLALQPKDTNVPKGAFWFEKKTIRWNDPNLDMFAVFRSAFTKNQLASPENC